MRVAPQERYHELLSRTQDSEEWLNLAKRWFVLAVWTLQAQAQQSGSGATKVSADFDPRKPPKAIDQPLSAKRPRSAPVLKQERIRRRPHYSDGGSLPRNAPILTVDRLLDRLSQPISLTAPLADTPPKLETTNLAVTPSKTTVADIPVPGKATVSFAGVVMGAPDFSPPDPNAAVGPEDVITVVNSRVAVYDKQGTLRGSIMTLHQWFTDLIATACPNGPRSCIIIDPIVRYDSLHGRFLLLATSDDGIRSYLLLAVSKGATHAGGWKNWALDATKNGTVQTSLGADFSKIGYDANAIYITMNMFSALDTEYAKLRILKKSELYKASTTELTYRDLWDLKNEDNSKAINLAPVQMRGRAGTGIPPGLMINAAPLGANSALTGAKDYLTLWRIENPTTNAPTTKRTTLKGLRKYDWPQPMPQKDVTDRLDTGDTTVLRAVLRDGILFTGRNTAYTDATTTVTYDRVDVEGNKVTLQARYLNGNFAYPAFDVTAAGGPSNVFPNFFLAGSTTTATGALSFPGVPNVKPGEDVYIVKDGLGRIRWGDYFEGAVDPVQGGLWVFGQFARPRQNTGGQWGTWASYFPWSTTAQFTDVPASNIFFDYVNNMKTWSVTSGCAAERYCPADNVTRGQMAVFIVRSIVGDTFTTETKPYFKDVPADHAFFKYVQKLKELGITSGCTADQFCPGDNVTRGQMAVFITRGKLYALQQDDFPFPSTAYFTDVDSKHQFFKFVQKMRELGITSGCAANRYCPDQAITRDQMAVFLIRGYFN